MDLKEIRINKRNWVSLAQDRDYWRALCECAIEPQGFISHGVSYILGFTGVTVFQKLANCESACSDLSREIILLTTGLSRHENCDVVSYENQVVNARNVKHHPRCIHYRRLSI